MMPWLMLLQQHEAARLTVRQIVTDLQAEKARAQGAQRDPVRPHHRRHHGPHMG